ncbi:MAG TPA: anaerobic ribonucleoside-triphosphate reductase [Negativicutes bacterium]|nr:anaerobic ribonucleoside-triphosphate reductase [Negativicutes bacterium]
MVTTIRKRDGRDVSFDPNKITEAIYKAAQSVGGSDREMAMELTLDVLRVLRQKYNGHGCGVEEVQDMVEKILIERGHAKTAKAYILYRSKRSRIREGKSELMDAVQDILVETSRDNANVSNSPSAKMLQIASAASKAYYLTRMIPEHLSQAHVRGDIHIHDLDFYGKTLNCVQIPLGRLLQEGFNNGHGYIRPPKRPASATALAAIILQSSQNDMFGGQSFAYFDRDMAPFMKNVDENEVFQAMEALIYNLNSMHSLPGDERIWIYDRQESRLGTLSMEEFHLKFEPGRFAALSMNYENGRTELKEITDSMKHYNFNRILRVNLKSGQTVAVTDNHSIMTIDNSGKVVTSHPEALRVGLVPAKWEPELQRHMYDLRSYPASRRYAVDAVELDENLARFFGYYVAGGSSAEAELTGKHCDKNMEMKVTSVLRKLHPRFTAELRTDRERNKGDLVCRVGSRFASFVRDVCGAGISTKRVPSEIFFASETIIRSFLDGFFSVHSGEFDHQQQVGATYARELRDGIWLLLTRLGIISALSQATLVSSSIAAAGNYYRIATVSSRGQDVFQVRPEDAPFDYEYLRPLLAEVCGKDFVDTGLDEIGPELVQKWAIDLAERLLTEPEQNRLEELAGIRPENLTLSGFDMPIAFGELFSRLFMANETGMTDCERDMEAGGIAAQWAQKILSQNEAVRNTLSVLQRAAQMYPIAVDSLSEEAMERCVYDIAVADNENFLTAQGIFVHNSRAGAQVPFSSLNVGTETTPEGRAVTRNLLLAYEKGLGKGENPIFPNVIFRLKKGINFNPEDPNYDLFQLAIRVASKRLNPTFSFMDSSFNKQYGTDVSYMGCRTRVVANVNGPAVTDGRGNLSFTTINLPRIAIKSDRNLMRFYQQLDEMLDLICEQLYHRFQVQASLKVKDMPFLMGQGLYLDSEKLKRDDTVESVIKHGTLSIGFIGLAETLVSLTGRHHGESDEAQSLGEEIVAFMRDKVDRAIDKYHQNYTLIATPAEGLSGRFVKMDRKEYGIIPGVTDREYYSNSFHIPVSFHISAQEKMRREGVYHKYTNAGHISYVEFDAPPINNPKAVEDILRCMAESDIGYAGINFPVDFCDSCGHVGVIETDCCPVCGAGTIRRVRRITGYLSTIERFNDPKQAELENRVTHFG